MSLKLIGVLCVITGCGGCGFLMAAQYLSNLRQLQNLIAALDYMHCELQYRCTPLPQLCRQAGNQSTGKVKQIFCLLADELDAQVSPNVERCMASVLDRQDCVSEAMHTVLLRLGSNLGRFDMIGQLQSLAHCREMCAERLSRLQQGKEMRLRSYQTLGLCAGAAIAILFV